MVGLDACDDQTRNPPLTGSVRDAITAVIWLRRLGVPDGQILLHASPSSGVQAELDALDIKPAPGREDALAASMQKLSKGFDSAQSWKASFLPWKRHMPFCLRFASRVSYRQTMRSS